MTAGPIQTPTAPATRAPSHGARTPQRLALATALWLIWGTPLVSIALTGPKFMEIFREFGVGLGSGLLLTLQLSAWIGSPLGIAFLALALPALCFAVATLILPPTATAPAPPGQARWPHVVIAIAGSLAGAVALWMVYTVSVSQAMLPIIDRLQSPPAATSTAPTPAASTPKP